MQPEKYGLSSFVGIRLTARASLGSLAYPKQPLHSGYIYSIAAVPSECCYCPSLGQFWTVPDSDICKVCSLVVLCSYCLTFFAPDTCCVHVSKNQELADEAA